MNVLGNLTPQEIAVAAFLHVPERPQPKKPAPPMIPGIPLPYFLAREAMPGLTRYTWRKSERSLSGLCCDLFFAEGKTAKAFARVWARRLPVECNGVLIRREQGEFKVSVPCCVLG